MDVSHVFCITYCWFPWPLLPRRIGHVRACNFNTNKVVIIFPTSKTNSTCTVQHVTINTSSTACLIKAITAYALIHPKRPGQFFIRLSGYPFFTQDSAYILNKLSAFWTCHSSSLNCTLCALVGQPIYISLVIAKNRFKTRSGGLHRPFRDISGTNSFLFCS